MSSSDNSGGEQAIKMARQVRQQAVHAIHKMFPCPRSTRVHPVHACLHELEGGQRGAKLAALLQVAGTHVVGAQSQAHLGEGGGGERRRRRDACVSTGCVAVHGAERL